MPLKIRVGCSDEKYDEEVHILEVSYFEDEDGYPRLEAVITHPGHDYAYDVGGHEFGYPLPYCYEAKEIIENGFDALLHDKGVRTEFIEALSKQGTEALGIDKEEFADIVIELAKVDNIGISTMKDIIATSMNWFGKTSTFKNEACGLAIHAYEEEDWDFFYVINKLLGKPLFGGLIKIVEEEDEDISNTGYFYTVTGATMKVFIGDKLVDDWSFRFGGWFCDITRMEWCVERLDGSGSSMDITDKFLKIAGFIDNPEEIEAGFKPVAPELPNRFGTGDYIIMHDEYEWGCFKTEGDAMDVYDAMRAGSDRYRGRHSHGSFGIDLTLLHRTKTPDKNYEIWKKDPLDEDDDGKDKDGYFLEIIGVDSI
jgi:hypothetical protein